MNQEIIIFMILILFDQIFAAMIAYFLAMAIAVSWCRLSTTHFLRMVYYR